MQAALLQLALWMRAVNYKPRGPTAGKPAAGGKANGAWTGHGPVEEPAAKPREGAPGREVVIGILAAAMTEACTAAGCRDVKARQLPSRSQRSSWLTSLRDGSVDNACGLSGTYGHGPQPYAHQAAWSVRVIAPIAHVAGCAKAPQCCEADLWPAPAMP